MNQQIQTTAQKQQPKPLATLKDLLDRNKEALAQALPKHLTVDRLVRVALAACGRTPGLLKCSPQSILQCVMQAAQLGLEPGSPLGEAYLVPYKETCTLIVGYRGLITLARRSGQIQSIEAHVVHSNDKFACRFGLTGVLEHEPAWSGPQGEVVAVYAIARLKDGGTQFEVMTKTQVDAIRARSKASGGGPWVSDYEEMARKTVVRRIAKYLPLSIEMAEAIDHEERSERPEIEGDVIDLSSLPAAPTKTDGIKGKLREKLAVRPPEPEQEAEELASEEAGTEDEAPAAAEAPEEAPAPAPATEVITGEEMKRRAQEATVQALEQAIQQAQDAKALRALADRIGAIIDPVAQTRLRDMYAAKVDYLQQRQEAPANA